MSAHTPGPWLISANDAQFVYALNPAGYNRLWLRVYGVHTPTEELEADARLIAAAPNLAFQLLAAANYIDALGGDSKSYRAALAEATGAKT